MLYESSLILATVIELSSSCTQPSVYPLSETSSSPFSPALSISYLRWPYKDVPFLWCHTDPTVEKIPCRKHVWSRLQPERLPHRDEKSINALIWNHVWYERSLSTELTLCLDHSLMTCLGHSGSFNQPQTQLLNETQYQVTAYREQASCSTQAARTSEPNGIFK